MKKEKKEILVLCTTHKVCCSLLKDLSVSNMRETQQVKKTFYTHFCKTSLFSPKSQHYFTPPKSYTSSIQSICLFKKKSKPTNESQQKHFMQFQRLIRFGCLMFLFCSTILGWKKTPHCPRWRTHPNKHPESKWPMALLMCKNVNVFQYKISPNLCQSNYTVYIHIYIYGSPPPQGLPREGGMYHYQVWRWIH